MNFNAKLKFYGTLFLRTLFASVFALLGWFFWFKIIKILPDFIYVFGIVAYFYFVILWYFAISSCDVFSTILGIIFSLLFIWSYGYNALYVFNESIFMSLVYAFGAFLGILQTCKSVGLRYSYGFKDWIK